MASASAIAAPSNAASTPVLSAASLIAMMKEATPEEKSAIAALIFPVASKKAAKVPSAAAPSAPVDMSARPAMPGRLVLVDGDKRCHARLSGPAGFLGKENGLPSGGFKCQILLESQCDKDATSNHLCTSCSEKKEKGWVKGKGNWHGLIGGAVPKESHCVGGEWAEKTWQTQWGISPTRSSPSPPKAEVKKEPKVKKEKKAAAAPAPAPAPKEASVAPPPAVVPKLDGGLIWVEELDGYVRLSDRMIFAAKVDDGTFRQTPDFDEVLGKLKAGVKPEEAVPTDMEAVVEEESASESESESAGDE